MLVLERAGARMKRRSALRRGDEDRAVGLHPLAHRLGERSESLLADGDRDDLSGLRVFDVLQDRRIRVSWKAREWSY